MQNDNRGLKNALNRQSIAFDEGSGSLGLDLDLVHEAPHPILSRLDGLHDRVLGRPEVLGGVLVLG